MRSPGILIAQCVLPAESLSMNRSDTADPPWCDFGPEMNNLLNRIGDYCHEKNIRPGDAERIFNAGMAARSAFRLDGLANQSADTSDAFR